MMIAFPPLNTNVSESCTFPPFAGVAPTYPADILYDMNNFFTDSLFDNYIKDTGSPDVIKDALCYASNHIRVNGTTQYVDYPILPTTLGLLWFDAANKSWSKVVSFPDVTYYRALISHSNACILNVQPSSSDLLYMNKNPNALVEMAYGVAHPGLSFTKANMQAYYVGNEGVSGASGVNDIMYVPESGKVTFYSTKTTAQTYTMRMPVGTTVTINGTVYNGNGTTNVVATVTGVGDVNIVESPAGCLTYFNHSGNQLTGSIPDLSTNPTLTVFACYTNNLTGSIPNLSANTSLTYFQCSSNQLVGSIPNLSANTAATVIQFSSNQLTGLIPNLSSNTALSHFECHTNQLTGHSGGNIKVTTSFRAENNLLPQSAVDSILQGLVSGGTTGAVNINLGGTGNSAPSAAGISNKNILIGRGCTVTTN